MQVWDEEQVRLFFAEAKRSSSFYRLYLTALLTGMRQGELLGLRWQDVDFLLGRLAVQHTFYRLGKEQLFREPKTRASRRTIDIAGSLLEELRRLRDSQAALRQTLGKEYEDRGLVFCQSNGRPLHAHNIIRRDFYRLVEKVGLPRIRFHDLRHCHATHLLRAGVHPKVVSERLGHARVGITMDVYSHVLPGMQKEAAKLVEDRLLGHDLNPRIDRD